MSKKNINRSNLYKPNTKLYIILTSSFTLIVFANFIIMCFNLNNPSYSIITSTIIGVFGGGLASIFVAWLIDISSCKSKNTYFKQREKQYLHYIAMLIDDLFQSFADAYPNSLKNHLEEKWDFWFKKLIHTNENRKLYDSYKAFPMTMAYVSLNEIISLVDQINSGELKEYVIKVDSEILVHTTELRDILYRIKDHLFVNKRKLSSEEMNYYKFTINDILSSIIAFNYLKFKKYTKEYNNEYRSPRKNYHLVLKEN